MSSKASNIIGWDIGGAHLKAVLLDAKGEVIDCLQLPCPLWKGLDFLQRAILDVLYQFLASPQNIPAEAGYSCAKANKIAASGVCHAITMTGELVDLFENRQQGVCEIAKLASKILGENCYFYAAPSCNKTSSFVRQQEVASFSSHIASANWHASASALAMHVDDALFVDIGSTTTDIIAIEGGKVVSDGLTDADRMQADSLVYTGVVRTPIMALAQKLPFGVGKNKMETNVAAEYFASMADVYRLTGELKSDDAETADGKGKSQLESARRLARMIGHDVDEHNFNQDNEKWIQLALACKTIQMRQIKTAMLKQLKPNMMVIGAGAGSFLVQQIAVDLQRTFKHAWEPISMRAAGHANINMQHDIDVCFAAYAVASLAQKHQLC